ncbi:MAG: hypothetical protein KDA21_09715 [Phycisphaerales bacterium]|nr:hypothetical protein [Phycisphaerales bacterium]
MSLRPLLEGGVAPERAYLYWEMFNGAHRYIQAARIGDMKALRRRGNRPDDSVELYDLGSDPGETTDLAGVAAYCGVLNELKGLMNTARVTPELNPDGDLELVPLLIEPCCAGDVNASGAVDFDDLNLTLEFWGQPHEHADIDGNGIVDISDLNEVLDGWLLGCGG